MIIYITLVFNSLKCHEEILGEIWGFLWNMKQFLSPVCDTISSALAKVKVVLLKEEQWDRVYEIKCHEYSPV